MWDDDLGFVALVAGEATAGGCLDDQRPVPSAETLNESVDCLSWLRVAHAVDDHDADRRARRLGHGRESSRKSELAPARAG
jgi:hypothetical protein